jgi:hypothetical protein
MRYVAIKSYKSTSINLLVVANGTRLHYERRITEWKDWLWCITEDGKSAAWVPEAWVTIDSEYCTLLRDYNSTELDVTIDDILEGDLIESGWLWARNDRGEEGWVPVACIKLIKD